jgi:hypothetical protein
MTTSEASVLLKAVVCCSSCYGAQKLMLHASYDVGVGRRQEKTAKTSIKRIACILAAP